MTETTTKRLSAMTKDEAKELLRTDIAQWNELIRAELREDDDYQVDLSNVRMPWGADLRGADLRGAYLQGADLRGAYLQGADLQGAYLRGAYLQGAYLQGAYLQGAYLQGAYLRGADLQGGAEAWNHPLWHIRQDVLSILDQAPAEVAALRAKMDAGEINGSVYEGDCACLCGTIALVHDADADYTDALKELGIKPSGSRPAEQWFYPIQTGSVPALAKLDEDKPEWADESEYRLTLGAQWVDEWIESRSAIAKVLVTA